MKVEKKFKVIAGGVINIGTKYHNIDSFFCIEVTTGMDGILVAHFLSKYGREHNDMILLESKTTQDAKKEVEKKFFDHDEDDEDYEDYDIQDYSQYQS